MQERQDGTALERLILENEQNELEEIKVRNKDISFIQQDAKMVQIMLNHG